MHFSVLIISIKCLKQYSTDDNGDEMLNVQHFPMCIYIYPNAFFAFIGMQSSPGLWTCFNSSPQASDHSVGSRGSDWSPLASHSSAILPILRSERLLMVQSARNENMLEMLWWGGLVCASGCSWSHRCVCVCLFPLPLLLTHCSQESWPDWENKSCTLIDPLHPAAINLIGRHILLPHICCKKCALWVQL